MYRETVRTAETESDLAVTMFSCGVRVRGLGSSVVLARKSRRSFDH